VCLGSLGVPCQRSFPLSEAAWPLEGNWVFP
jgi:hypothetical protein